jgi:polycystin 1L2
VGPLSDAQATECYAKHLTTFTGGFDVLPSPINWNYAFANADFLRNKTIYLTVIIVCVLYLLLMIYARYADMRDVGKVKTHRLEGDDTGSI